MNSKQDDYVKAGADILLKGGKMLNIACPTCRSPLYKFKGKTICVKCKQEYVLVDDKEKLPQKGYIASNQSTAHSPIRHSPSNSQTPSVLSETYAILTQKLSQLNKKLEQAVDIDEIISINNAIKSLLETLKVLK